MEPEEDLPFTWHERADGSVAVAWHGRVVTTLRGREAVRFLAAVRDADTATAQRCMARATGQFKRGNERGWRRS